MPAAVERGDISAYAAAAEVGFLTRKQPTGRGSPNMAKRRAHRIRAVEAGRVKYWRETFEQLFDPELTLADCRRLIERARIPWPLVAQWATEYLEKEEPPSVAAEGL